MRMVPLTTIWKDHEAACIAAAHYFVMLCQRSIADHGKFIVALSGGNTPKRLYELLASNEFSRNIDWKKVFLFWSDERFVPPTDTDSNYRMAKEALLDHISIPAENIFPVPTDSKPETEAKKYEKSILSFFGKKKISFDCVLLGMGNDGHTASLFPGTKILKEKKRLVKEVWVEEKKTWRISFTLSLINKAASILFLVTGKDKAPVLVNILSGKKRKPLLPAQRVEPAKGNIMWMVDEDAAAKI